jgi:hypothetical protein
MINKFENIYLKAEQGTFDQEYVSLLGEGNFVTMSVELLESECVKQGVDFRMFLEYAINRKEEEMKK